MLNKTNTRTVTGIVGSSKTVRSEGNDLYARGTKVLSRDAKLIGLTTGGARRCTLEGCGAPRIGVRWPDGKLTYPCVAGLHVHKGQWKIA